MTKPHIDRVVVLLLCICWPIVAGLPNNTVPDSSRSKSGYKATSGYYCAGCNINKTRTTRQYSPSNYYDRIPISDSSTEKIYASRYVPAITNRLSVDPIARASAIASPKITTYDNSYWNSGCSNNPCASTALCREINGRPVCSCPSGYVGNPMNYCRRAEYDSSKYIDYRSASYAGRTIECSSGTCGTNANCVVKNQVQVCSCPDGYRGDPLRYCSRIDPAELCNPSPCGKNTKCEVIGGVPTCSCLPNFYGHPLNGCRHQCEQDDECSRLDSCQEFHCKSACSQCGKGAHCRHVQNHKALCECPQGFIGSPLTECRPECRANQECPNGRPLCRNGVCLNPCNNACGAGAECNLNGSQTVCSCPPNTTGNPYHRCRPFTRDDVCAPNPCGTNALCDLVPDKINPNRAVCTCPPGTTGDPWIYCGECQNAKECSDQQTCINHKCVNACAGVQCGYCAECGPKNHVAACKCLSGYTGNALVSCRPIAKPEARYVSSRPIAQSDAQYISNRPIAQSDAQYISSRSYPDVWYQKNYDHNGRYYFSNNYN